MSRGGPRAASQDRRPALRGRVWRKGAMAEPQILLCGATGELGGEIARRLAATGVPG